MEKSYRISNTLKRKIGLDTTIRELIVQEKGTISTRLSNTLREMSIANHKNRHYQGIQTVEELIIKKDRLYRMPNFGNESLAELNFILTKYGLPNLDLDMKKKRYRGWRGLYFRGYRG